MESEETQIDPAVQQLTEAVAIIIVMLGEKKICSVEEILNAFKPGLGHDLTLKSLQNLETVRAFLDNQQRVAISRQVPPTGGR